MTGKSIAEKIILIEQSCLGELSSFVENHFEQIFLPSHDHTHHLRVWNITKNIIQNIAELNPTIDEDYIEAALFSALFHDTGLTITRSSSHGVQSKGIYLEYLEKEKHEPKMHQEICRAIEFHDRKGQDIYESFTSTDRPDLLTLISIADDLDALGTIGIYRYAEIYLHRAIPIHSLGMKILENITSRYNQFVKASIQFPSIINTSKKSYQAILSFYNHYNQQLLVETDPNKVFSGHIGVVNYINQFSVLGKYHPLQFPEVLEPFSTSKFIDDFFIQLKHDCLENS